MNRFIRWYNKNRKMFWLVIVIGIIVSTIPRILNEIAKDKKDVNSSINNTTIYNNEDYSVITDEIVNEEVSKENTNIINEFIDFCNEGNVENAYQLLSEDCKKVLYPTIEAFEEKYYNKIFKEKKSYNKQSWISEGNYYTYKVEFKEDILATGNSNALSTEDYYTVVKTNDGNKLNINSYIGNAKMNKDDEEDKIDITIVSKDVFMEYEIYNIKVTNRMRKFNIA